MLTTEDLKAIGIEVGRVIEDNVTPALDGLGQRLDKVELRLDGVETRLGKVESRLDKVESQMVTKDYLDEKLIDLRGDLIVLMRKEDAKLKNLVEVLYKKQLLSNDERESILALEPFAQTR